MDEQNFMDELDNLIELIDEDGNSTMFEHVATVEHEGEVYLMVVEEESLNRVDQDEEEELDALILKIESDENGEDTYVTLEDEELAEIVFQKCLEVLQEDMDDEE